MLRVMLSSHPKVNATYWLASKSEKLRIEELRIEELRIEELRIEELRMEKLPKGLLKRVFWTINENLIAHQCQGS